jgi:hypothetical protein
MARPHCACVLFVLEAQHDIIGIAHNVDLTSRVPLPPLMRTRSAPANRVNEDAVACRGVNERANDSVQAGRIASPREQAYPDRMGRPLHVVARIHEACSGL